MSPALKDAGKLITDPREKVQLLNNQFRSVFSPKKHTTTAEEFELRCPPQPDPPDYPYCNNINMTEEGVKKLLLNLNPNKACSPDDITPRLMKTVVEEITPALTLIFRNSYSKGTLPPDWKLADVTPVLKK